MLHIDVSGRGPALVLLHGWGLHGGVFEPLVQALAGSHTVYRVDLPGHGRSREVPVPDTLAGWAEAVLEEVPTAPWIGWSLGGLVAQQAALQAPAAVPALAVMASSPCFLRGTDWPHGIDPAVMAGFADHFQHRYADTVERFLALDLLHLPAGPQAAARLRDELLAVGRPAPAAITTGARLLQSTDLRARLPGLQVPSLWLAGQRDRLAPPAAMQAASRLAPAGQALTVPGTGHAPFLGDTAAVARALDGFLAAAR